jgi:hypothetical protein
MPRKKFDLINLPRDPAQLQLLIESATADSIDPGITFVKQHPIQRNVSLRPQHTPEFTLAFLTDKKAAIKNNLILSNDCECGVDKGGDMDWP